MERKLIPITGKNQITIPINWMRKLGLEAKDKFIATFDGECIRLEPQPKSYADYFNGILSQPLQRNDEKGE